MTDKEQIEKAKANWHYRSGSLSDNVKWLIEQAEQVPTLESYMNTLAKYGDDTRNKLLEVKKENKRYREALEEIAKGEGDYYDNENAKIALAALRGD